MTFLTSAFWHGFYPFYYFMFAMCAMIVELAKDVYRARVLFEWVPFPSICANLVTMLLLDYLGTSFNQLTFERGFNFAKATNYFGFIAIPLLLFISKASGMVGIAKKRMAKDAKKVEQDGPKKELKKDK